MLKSKTDPFLIRKRWGIVMVFLIGSLCFTFSVSAQQNTKQEVHVQVTDQKQDPLIGALIQTYPKHQQIQTDVEGWATLNIQQETESVVVISQGFVSDTISLKKFRNDTFKTTLIPVKELAAVEIVSKKKSTEMSLISTSQMQTIGTKELMKAACCNLSESFETTPSIDVGFTDAVSGYKQVQMLGLAGTYTLFTRENIPDIYGLASVTGLTFTPGTWVESMQLSKGSGSVVNGYEGTTGQINVEWIKPFSDDVTPWILNGYQNTQGRSEGNIVWNKKFNDKLSTNLLLHGRGDWAKVDQNKDGFLDQPLGKSFIGSNRWFYFDDKGWELQGGIKGVYLDNYGGQSAFNPNQKIDTLNPWGYTNTVHRWEGWAKLGWVNINRPGQSVGLQLGGTYHDQKNSFGLRNYAGNQKSFYSNLIGQQFLGNSNHVLKTGLSFKYDYFDETFNQISILRNETAAGIFGEYTYNYLDKFSVVAGLRSDYHNKIGVFFTPRLHLRYAVTPQSAFRASIGRALRTPNIISENLGSLVSNRQFILPQNLQENFYGLNPEVAWNMGASFTQKFLLNYRDGAFSIDYYYTHFENQVVVDIEDYHSIRFYNLQGSSYAHSIQAQLDYEPIHNWDVRLSYRFYDVKTTYLDGLKDKPLISKHRVFVNTGYRTKSNWKFDVTANWIGPKRIPTRIPEGNTHLHEASSPSYILVNAQINKSWNNDKLEVYIGSENLTNFMQHDLILGADAPFSRNFDGSLIWGPAMGINIYAGFKVKL